MMCVMRRLPVLAGLMFVQACDDPCLWKEGAELEMCEMKQKQREETEEFNGRVDELIDGEPIETQRYAQDGLRFALYGCKRWDRTDVVCALEVTGEGFDWTLNVAAQGNDSLVSTPEQRCGPSLVYDDRGGEYKATEVYIGDQKSPGCAYRTVIAATPTPVVVRVSNVHQGVNALARLSLAVKAAPGEGAQWKAAETLEFSNIPVR